MGRPRKIAGEKRSERITIHWKIGEQERIAGAADLLGLPLADFLRMAGLMRAREVLERAGRNDILMGKPTEST